MQQLGDQSVGHARVDHSAEVDDPLRQQVRVDVHDPLATHTVRDDVGDGVRTHERAPVSKPSPSLWVRTGTTWLRSLTTWSMKPYSRACSVVNHRSCSESAKIRSIDWPV